MPKKKPATNQVPTNQAQKGKGQEVGDDDPLALSRYYSLIGTHILLLLFSMLMSPRTSLAFTELPPQTSSLDRPQSEFMAPITAWPAWSVAWMALSAGLVQTYWSTKAVDWIREDTIKETGVARDEYLLRVGPNARQDLWKAWAMTVVGALGFHALIIIFGAPVTTYIPHTFALASLISILTIYAPVRSLSLPSTGSTSQEDVRLKEKWSRIFTQMKPKSRAERALLYPALCTILGAWCGAYPLALDWDRPWQSWPLTPAMGAIIGYVVGELASAFVSTVIYLARITPDPKKAQ